MKSNNNQKLVSLLSGSPVPASRWSAQQLTRLWLPVVVGLAIIAVLGALGVNSEVYDKGLDVFESLF